MSDVLNGFLFILLGVLAICLMALTVNLLRQGPTHIKKLRKEGYGLRALWSGQLPKPTDGSTIEVIEGLEFIANEGRYDSVRRTRTLSTENC